MPQDLRAWERRIGRRLKLRDLHVLSVVVRWGSMARAASELAISQPAVSESIAALEGAVRVRLLERNSRGVAPTVYAQALLRRADAVFDELAQGVKEIDFLADPTRGEVRVASGDTGTASLLPEVIERLGDRHPGIVVHVGVASAEPLLYPELRDRTVDVVLARMSKDFTHPAFDIEPLFDDPARVVAAAASPWARRKRLRLADLASERWTLTSDAVIRDAIDAAFRSAGLAPPASAVVASSMLLRSRLVATGRYLTVLPDSVLRANAARWSLATLPVALDAMPMAVSLVTLRHRTISPVTRLFMEEVRAAAQRTGTRRVRRAASTG